MSRPLAERDVSQPPSTTRAPSPAEKLDRILRNLALLALQETRASSAAIGLLRDDEVICRAVAGPPLAQVGAPINMESGLAAMAVERAMSQWCSDTESDGRVDAKVCRRLGVRSVMIVPVRSAEVVVGIFAIFSAAPDAFCLANLNTMHKLAHWASKAIDRTIRIVPPQASVPAPAKTEDTEPHLPPSLYSEPSRGTKMTKFVGQIWRTLVLVFSRGDNR
jgi:putative methionine-R-sulfoxide reductase with GAF domain